MTTAAAAAAAADGVANSTRQTEWSNINVVLKQCAMTLTTASNKANNSNLYPSFARSCRHVSPLLYTVETLATKEEEEEKKKGNQG